MKDNKQTGNYLVLCSTLELLPHQKTASLRQYFVCFLSFIMPVTFIEGMISEVKSYNNIKGLKNQPAYENKFNNGQVNQFWINRYQGINPHREQV